MPSFFLSSIDFARSIVYGERERERERERGERQRAGERNEVETTGKRITFYVCGNALTFPILLKWKTILCFTTVKYLSIKR